MTALARPLVKCKPSSRGWASASSRRSIWRAWRDTAAVVESARTTDMLKALPPVLPPLAGGEPRTFSGMDDYYERVLVPGSYGVARGPERPKPRPPERRPLEQPLPAEHAELPVVDASAVVAAVRITASLPPLVVDGVPAPQGVEVVRFGAIPYVRLGEWAIRLAPAEVRVTGPITHVPAVTRLAERLGAEYAPGAPIVWDFGRSHRERVYVRATACESCDGRFLARGTEILTALGYLPALVDLPGRPGPKDAVALMQQARRADDEHNGAFVASSHPRFAQLSRLAGTLARDQWVRVAHPHAPATARLAKRLRDD